MNPSWQQASAWTARCNSSAPVHHGAIDNAAAADLNAGANNSIEAKATEATPKWGSLGNREAFDLLRRQDVSMTIQLWPRFAGRRQIRIRGPQ